MIGAAVPVDDSYSPARREGCIWATLSGNLNGNFSVSLRLALNDKANAFWTRLKSPSCCSPATQHVRSRLAHINSIKYFSFLWSPCFFAAASHLRFAIRSFFNDFFLPSLLSIVRCRCYKEENERRRFGGAVAHSIVSRRCAFECVGIDWYCIRENFVGTTRARKLVIAKPSFAPFLLRFGGLCATLA